VAARPARRGVLRGRTAAGLLLKDSVTKTGHTHHQFGVEPHYLQLYRDVYCRFDPLAPLFFCDIGEVTSRSEYLADNEFYESRFHHEWAKPQGWIDAANVVLEKSATGFGVLSVMRQQDSGMADEEMRRNVQFIAPHLQRASAISGMMEQKSAEATTFAETLDGLDSGVILVDAGGRIVHANAAADAILCACDVLQARGGRLTANDAEGTRALHDVLATAAGDDAVVGRAGMTVPLAGGGEPYVVHALPMTSGARRAAGAKDAVAAALFIRKAGRAAPLLPEVIARSYRLTPTELRVLLAIVEVGGVPETADRLGIGAATVRTHLHRLFAKTGTRRQADLVKLVAAFASPLKH
jgi:DNA-binding CsgD family transcriptional regulator/PAS domain-containing protein